MAFELYPFDRTSATNRPLRGPGITLGKHGQLLLNAETFVALGRPQYVCLLYDRTTHTIGLKVSTEEDRHALRVSHPRRTPYNHRVSSKGFCAYFGLQAYVGHWYGGHVRGDVLYVTLGAQPPTEVEAEVEAEVERSRPGTSEGAARAGMPLLVDALPLPLSHPLPVCVQPARRSRTRRKAYRQAGP